MRGMYRLWLALLLFTLPLTARGLRLAGGLVDHQVLQRDERGLGSVTVTADSDGGPVTAVILKDGQPLADAKPVVKQDAKKVTVDVALPTGGPYSLVLSERGHDVTVNDVYVGDLWVLAGQSNMEGVGNLEDVEPPNPRVHSFDQTDVWGLATEPLHSLPNAADRVHWGLDKEKKPVKLTGKAAEEYIKNRKRGAGLGLPFAVYLLQVSGVPIGLLPCAHGGTSMAQWDPSLRDQAGDSLYGATYRRIMANGGKVKGILWYQGESDASDEARLVYRQKFKELIEAFRADLKQPELPFYYVQIGRHVANDGKGNWSAIQEDERLLEKEVPHTAMVSAINVSLDDGIHVGTQDLKRLGRALGRIACRDMGIVSCLGYQNGPRPGAMEYNADAGIITLHFEGVNGRLTSEGRLNGFELLDEKGNLLVTIFKQRVSPADPTAVEIFLDKSRLPKEGKLFLRYGVGRNPYCNLKDALDMDAPVIGLLPVPMKPAAASLPR